MEKDLELKTLEKKLQSIFGEQVTIDYIKPLKDEDFEACYAVCYEDVILANPTSGLKIVSQQILDYLVKKELKVK